MKVESYLSFNGKAEEALNFYAEVFNGTIVQLLHNGDFPDMEFPLEFQSKVAHSELKIGETSIFMDDARPGTKTDFGHLGITNMVHCDTEQDLRDIYAKLSEGGQIRCELSTPFFAKFFAEIVDKFGVAWSLIIMN